MLFFAPKLSPETVTTAFSFKKYIDKCFSSYKSGIINPKIDKNWKEKVDNYFKYISTKRDVYKDWFIDNRKPKAKK